MKRWLILASLLLASTAISAPGSAEAFIPSDGPSGKALSPVEPIFKPSDDGKPPEEIKAAFEQGERTRTQREADTKDRIKAAVAEQKANRPGEAAELRAELRKLRTKLARLQAMKGHFLGPLPMRTGGIGELSPYTFKVTQVVNERNLLVSDRDRSFWISNIATEGLVDGDRISLLTAVHCVGPKKYESVLGAGRTVMEIQPFDISPFLPKK